MIKVFDTPLSLCQNAMKIFIQLAQENIDRKGNFIIALSGGNTPNLLYDLMAKNEIARNLAWDKIYVFWGDERYVDYQNPENNAFQAYKHLLKKISIPEKNIFRIPVTGNTRQDAGKYQKEIADFFNGKHPAFDLIFLGLGDEGHTASIFPGSELLHEKQALVKDIYVEVKKSQRISFTPVLLNAAKEVVFMVTGITKAKAVKEIIEGKYQPDIYPAQIVKPRKGNITWLLDNAAASQLSSHITV